MQEHCFLHEDRIGANRFNIPCAPGGGCRACDECHEAAAGSELRRQFFLKYAMAHEPAIKAKRAVDPMWRDAR